MPPDKPSAYKYIFPSAASIFLPAHLYADEIADALKHAEHDETLQPYLHR